MQRWPSPKQSLPVFKLWTPVTAIGHVQKQTQTVCFHAWEMVLAVVGSVVHRGRREGVWDRVVPLANLLIRLPSIAITHHYVCVCALLGGQIDEREKRPDRGWQRKARAVTSMGGWVVARLKEPAKVITIFSLATLKRYRFMPKTFIYFIHS